MIVVFTYFYTAMRSTQPNGGDLKRQNSFVPGVKPGRPTAEFLDEVLSRITLPAPFSGTDCGVARHRVPAWIDKAQTFAIFFGELPVDRGGVTDTLQRIELLARRYDGLMKVEKCAVAHSHLWEACWLIFE